MEVLPWHLLVPCALPQHSIQLVKLVRPWLMAGGAAGRRGFERLVRKLTKIKAWPALLYIHMYQPFRMRSSFWASAETEMEQVRGRPSSSETFRPSYNPNATMQS